MRGTTARTLRRFARARGKALGVPAPDRRRYYRRLKTWWRTLPLRTRRAAGEVMDGYLAKSGRPVREDDQ